MFLSHVIDPLDRNSQEHHPEAPQPALAELRRYLENPTATSRVLQGSRRTHLNGYTLRMVMESGRAEPSKVKVPLSAPTRTLVFHNIPALLAWDMQKLATATKLLLLIIFC